LVFEVAHQPPVPPRLGRDTASMPCRQGLAAMLCHSNRHQTKGDLGRRDGVSVQIYPGRLGNCTAVPRHDLKPTWYCARAWPRPRVNRWPFTPTWHSARVQENLRCQRQVSAFSNATTVRCLNLCVSGMGVGVPPGTKSLPTSQVAYATAAD
jgi:hypothetical protein